MAKTDIADRQPDTGFDALKKAIARLMGVKRLEPGANFAAQDTAAPFVGKRQYNMGDLWREPSDKLLLAGGEPSDPSIGE